MTEPLSTYVSAWAETYRTNQRTIPLFEPARTALFTIEQQRLFFERFNELRRHFNAMLGELMAFAPTQPYKQALLANLKEETGANDDGQERRSHDELYNDAASVVGVNMIRSIYAGRTKTPYGKRFNEHFNDWIIEQLAEYGPEKGWHRIWAAVEAYEKLDNVDYPQFLVLAKSFGLTGKALVFFEIHTTVGHYEHGEPLLKAIWEKDPESVQAGFAFIKRIQLAALEALSDDLFSHSN